MTLWQKKHTKVNLILSFMRVKNRPTLLKLAINWPAFA